MKLRHLTADELPLVLDWARDEGWNPGEEDAPAFFDADPKGFFAAEIDGRPAAAISVVNHSEEFAFLGLYICRPEHRGQGVGYALWQHALAHAGNRVVGLDGVPAQQANYARSGFAPVGRTARHVGAIEPRDHHAVRPIRPQDGIVLVSQDAIANGYGKGRFLARWLNDTQTRKTLVFEEGGEVSGFATIRRCRQGSKIGPLVAHTAAQAKALMHAAARFAGGEPIMIDWPSDMVEMAGYCAGLGMTVPFTTARMYRGPAPQTGRMIRAVATLELG